MRFSPPQHQQLVTLRRSSQPCINRWVLLTCGHIQAARISAQNIRRHHTAVGTGPNAGDGSLQQPSGGASASSATELPPVVFSFTDISSLTPTSTAGVVRPMPPPAGLASPPAVSTSGPIAASSHTRSPEGVPLSHKIDAFGLAGPAGTGSSSSSNGSSPSVSGSYSDYYRTQNTSISTASTSTDTSQGSSPSGSISVVIQPTGIGAQAGYTQKSDSDSTASSCSTAAAGKSSEESVSDALARAQAALARAETSLDDIAKQQEEEAAAAAAAPNPRWQQALSIARKLVSLGVLCVGVLASHASGLVWQWTGATLAAVAIAVYGYQRRSLAVSGAVAAFAVGCGTLGSSLRLGATLIAFFLSSSWLTQYKEEMKEGLEEGGKKGGQRTWVQVLCNGGVPLALAVWYGFLAGCVDLPLGPLSSAGAGVGVVVEAWRAQMLTASMGAYLGYLACCCGDTWASELGPLSSDQPRLITTMRPVRRGTNGGVTLLGLSASILGGMFIGSVFFVAGLMSPTLWIFEQQRAVAAAQWKLIPLGLVAGLFGSVLDSLLGATLQYTGYDRSTGRIVSKPGPSVTHIAGLQFLDNNAVNAVSATTTAGLTALLALRMFGL